MLVHKIWKEEVRWPGGGSVKETRLKEGWFLLGIIPIYVRVIQHAI